MPGFVCFVSADDIPGSNATGIGNDEAVFAKDTVCSLPLLFFVFCICKMCSNVL